MTVAGVVCFSQLMQRKIFEFGNIYNTSLTQDKELNILIYTVSKKEVPTFKLSVTLSDLKRFSELCTAGSM